MWEWCPLLNHERLCLWNSLCLGVKHRGTLILVPRNWYQDLDTKILVPGSWYQNLGTRSWYQVSCDAQNGSCHSTFSMSMGSVQCCVITLRVLVSVPCCGHADFERKCLESMVQYTRAARRCATTFGVNFDAVSGPRTGPNTLWNACVWVVELPACDSIWILIQIAKTQNLIERNLRAAFGLYVTQWG